MDSGALRITMPINSLYAYIPTLVNRANNHVKTEGNRSNGV